MKKQKELAHMLSVVNELNAQLTAQLAEKDAEAAHWKANHDNMVKKNALLSQRHDLPVDRIQAAKHFDDLSAEVERLRIDNMHMLANLIDADNLAKVIDEQVSGNRIDARSAIADARLDYGSPHEYQWKQQHLSTTQQEEG
jgi:hypothetical protein